MLTTELQPERKRPYQRTQFIHVYSARRTVGSPSSSQFQVILSNPVDDVVAVDASEIRIPKTFYNITSANNNIDINDGKAKSTSITAGNYGAYDLATAVQTALNGVSAGWTVTYNPNQFTMTIANAGSFSVLFGTGPHASTSLAVPMGFTAVDLTGQTSYTGPNVVNLQNPDRLFIRCTEVGASSSSSGSMLNWSWSLLMAGSNSGDEVVSTVNSTYENSIKMHKRTLKTLNFTVGDDQGALVSLNGADWSILMKAYLA